MTGRLCPGWQTRGGTAAGTEPASSARSSGVTGHGAFVCQQLQSLACSRGGETVTAAPSLAPGSASMCRTDYREEVIDLPNGNLGLNMLIATLKLDTYKRLPWPLRQRTLPGNSGFGQSLEEIQH